MKNVRSALRMKDIAIISGKSLSEVKREFEPIVEAIEESGIYGDKTVNKIQREIVSAWMYGACEGNFQMFLDAFGINEFVNDLDIDALTKHHLTKPSGIYDHWVMLKMLATRYIGDEPSKELQEEFDKNVMLPLQQYIEAEKANKQRWQDEREKAKKYLKSAIKPLQDTLAKIEKNCDKIIIERSHDVYGMKIEIANLIESLEEL